MRGVAIVTAMTQEMMKRAAVHQRINVETAELRRKYKD